MTSPNTPALPGSPQLLASRTAEAIGRAPDRRTGVVASIDGGVLTVSVGGGATERVGYLASYEPVVGDVVALVQQRSTWLCIGRMVAFDDVPVVAGAAFGGVLFATGASTVINSGTEAIVTGYTFTADLPAGHLVRIHALYTVVSSTSDSDFPFMRIRETDLAGAVVYGAYSPVNQNAAPTVQRIDLWMRPTAAATKTYVMTAQRLFGAATFTISRFGLFAAFDHGRSPNVTTL